MFEINGKNVAVTGAASGIGLETVKTLLAKGANVVMSDYNEASLEKECKALEEIYGEKIAYKVVNVTDESQVKNLVAYTVEKYGTIDVMVNNAGIGSTGTLISDEAEKIIPDTKRIIDINLNGVIYGCKYAADQMIKQGQGGAIINTSSIMGHVSHFAACSGYSASKHGVIGYTKSCAVELASYNIRVNAICPGFITTGMVNEEVTGSENIKYLLAAHPLSAALHRLGNPEEIAHAIVFMIENTFLTGQSIIVDGGYLAQ